MEDRTLYASILGIHAPWRVRDVDVNHEDLTVVVKVTCRPGGHCCPVCGVSAGGYDHRTRRWRHLDTCQYRTIIEADVPRVKCPEHGVRQTPVPWAESNSRYTAMFEALVLSWLNDASMEAVARHFGLSWDAVDGIMRRAVNRGLARKEERPLKRIGVDETSYRKGHNYLTVVTDLERGTVEHVGEDRSAETLEKFYNSSDIRGAVWHDQFQDLRKANLKTARAWAIRLQAMSLWRYRVRGWARKGRERCYSWAIRSRLEPVKSKARMIKKHLWGIVNAVVLKTTNAGAELMNSKIQGLKKRARSYRNTERLKTAIYFHFGGLDMSPATHTI